MIRGDISLISFVELLTEGTRFNADDCKPLQNLQVDIPIIEFKSGETIIKEGVTGDSAYLIISGSVEIQQRSRNKTLGQLGAGNIVGEMALSGYKTRAASVIALTDILAYRISRELYHKFQEILPDFQLLLTEKTYDQLSRKHQELIKRHEQLQELQKQKRALTYLFVTMILLLTSYALINSFLIQVMDLPSDGSAMFYISRAMELIGVGILIQIVRYTSLNLEKMGLRIKGSVRSAVESIAVSAVIMVFFYYWAEWANTNQGVDTGLDWSRFNWSYLTYLVIAPLQEWISRGVFQTSLEQLIENRYKGLLAVLITSMIFATLHLHLNPAFALITLISSLFWGWMFIRHRSLVGVSISHFLLGNWFGLLGLWALWT